MDIISPVFEQGQLIPSKFSYEGQNVSPPLNLNGIPKGTKSLALIVDDPDAPNGVVDHWVAWNLVPTDHLSEGSKTPNQGVNTYGTLGYRGPNPPPGKPHRYFFKVYALDVQLDLPNGSNKAALEAAIEGHVIAQAELIGVYQR